MKNKTILLDKERCFKYGMRSLSNIEEAMNIPFTKIEISKLTLKDAATIIWAGLKHEDGKLTPEKVMDIIDNTGVSLNHILGIAGEAMSEASELLSRKK